MLKVIEINTLDNLLSLKDKWHDFLNDSHNNNMFMTWEWLTIWWKQYGDDKDLKILMVKGDHDEFVCLVPLMISQREYFGFNLKVIEFIGKDQADYIDIIIKDYNEEIFNAIFNYLNSTKWDIIDLQLIPENSPTIEYLTNIATQQGYLVEKSMKETSPYLKLPKTWDEFYKNLSRKKRSNFGRCERKLNEKYKLSLKVIKDLRNINSRMEIFTNMHQKLWEGKNGGNLFTDEKFKMFLNKIAKEFVKKKWLYFTMLEADDQPIATLFGFKYSDTIYFYLTAYDLNYKKFSPGTILFGYTFRDAIEHGYYNIDFLKGGEFHKYSWKSSNNGLARLIIGGKTIVSKIYLKARQTREIIKG